MCRLARHAASMIAMMLLSVATASGNCAWVLWVGEWYDTGIGHPWSVLQAASAQEDCLDAMRRAVDAYKEKLGSKRQIGRDTRDPWAVMLIAEGPHVTLRCLPDTVDPRATQAK